MREDLPRGVLAAQVTHAAGESSPGALSDGTIAVVLAAANEDHLRLLSHQLTAAGLPHRLIVENEGPYAMQATAIGVVPVQDRLQIRKVVRNLPLLT